MGRDREGGQHQGGLISSGSCGVIGTVMLDLNGKVAFVAGAGSVAEGWGNGRATAVLLARQGAKVFGTDYNGDALLGTSSVMEQEGHGAWTPWRADMTDTD